jgi:hypothetical protein
MCDLVFPYIRRSDATFIICCEAMSTSKKLLCGHLFHVHCRRTMWALSMNKGCAASVQQHGDQPGG